MLHCPRNIMRTVAFSGYFSSDWPCLRFAADPTGDWRVADGVANIRVAECNGSMWGAVAWEKTPGGRDKNNPDASKQSRPTLGMPILIDMKKKPGVDQWEGQVYNAKDGQILQFHDQAGRHRSDSKFKGCVLGFLCGGETWTRVGPRFPRAPPTAWPRARRRRQRAAQDRSTAPRRPPRRRPPAPPARHPNRRVKSRRRSRRSGRRYLSTPRHRAVCPLARAGTTAPRPAW